MMARILCLLILLLEIRGLSLSLPGRKWMALIFYTAVKPGYDRFCHTLADSRTALLGDCSSLYQHLHAYYDLLRDNLRVDTDGRGAEEASVVRKRAVSYGPYPFFRVHNQSAAATVL